LPGIEVERVWKYFQLWDDFHCLNTLPHGRGTRDEHRVVLDIIKIGVKAFKSAENWKIKNSVRADIEK
jgi:hypothetical protein